MDNDRMSEDLVQRFLGSAKGFTPIAVSADFAALRCPLCLKDTSPPQGAGIQGEVLEAA